MQVDIKARLLSAVQTADGEMALTFQVKRPSLRYDVGRTYAITEPLFEEVATRSSANRSKMDASRESLSHPGNPVKRGSHPGRPTNKVRIARYIAEHGGTKEHAARVLGIRM